MRPPDGKLISAWAACWLALVCCCLAGCEPTAAGSNQTADQASIQLSGAGATFPEPIYTKWAGQFAELNPVTVNYQPIGSGGGIAQAKARTVDFGASDAPLKPKELAEADLLQFPMVVGGVVPVVNLDGIAPGQLCLNAEVFIDLLLGEIRRWDDPRLVELNPGLKLPSRDVTVVYRSDPSGTTWIFTNYLAAASAKWKSRVGAGKGVDWPVGIAGKGNQGVATYVSRIQGAIGYVEFAYAKLARLTTTQLENAAGQFVQPSLESFQAAADHADWASAQDYYLILVNQPGDQTWPITGASFIVMQRQGHKPERIQAMLAFFDWCYAHGADLARELDYAPLPENVADLVRASWRGVWPAAMPQAAAAPASTATAEARP
ncbi:MAG: phosphate ABC transporter substrate-binding protein PstS [Pirellulales bacterium]|nr:phosphate ABC transporter substrate-binding protein PstS [Pirellulales bacterium]